jgi:hypothetical protein
MAIKIPKSFQKINFFICTIQKPYLFSHWVRVKVEGLVGMPAGLSFFQQSLKNHHHTSLTQLSSILAVNS